MASISPRVQVRVPGRTVIESESRNPFQCVVRPVSIVEVSRESLTLSIIATFRAVGGDEDALNRASGAVIIAQQKLTHQWSVRVVLDRGRKGDTGVHRDVPNRAAEAEAVDQVQGNG